MKNTHILSKEVIEKIEKAGFVVEHENKNEYYFGRWTPAGQNWGFHIDVTETFNEFVETVYEYYESFDCSYETYLYLDNTGHGTNGAPYDMKDVYEDMQECENYILELYEILKEEL